MAIVDFPITAAFQSAQFSLWVNTSERAFTGFFTGNRNTRSNSADRLGCQVTLPPVKNRIQAAAREAFIMGLRSTGDHVRFGMPHRAVPLGNMRGSATVAGNVLAGARSLILSNARAGNNLLRSVEQVSTWLGAGWTTLNATVTQNAIAGPDGTTTAWVLTRTATGNHYAYATATVASTASKTISAFVWLKVGTLTGNVVLRLRDGADNEYASITVTPTSSWALYKLTALFGGSAAPDVRIFMDPLNDAGSAGDTLHVWYSEVRVSTGFDTNCITWASQLDPPAGALGAADEVRRTSTSNAFTVWGYTTSAHAGRTFTFSVWLKSGTFAGNVQLHLRDGANNNIASATASITGTWTRYSVTGTFGASPAADILVYVDPADGGSIGQTFGMYGVQLELGGTPTDFTPWPTARAGDFFGVGGNLLQVATDATGDVSGAITLALTTPSQKAITSGAAAVISGPTGVWELEDTGVQVDYSAPIIQGPMVLRFRQVPQ